MNNSMTRPNPRRQRNSSISLPVDVPLLLIVLILIVFGLMMVFSASHDYSLRAFDDASYILNRQLLWLAIGLVAFVAMAFIDYHYWRALAVPLMGFTLVSLIAVALFGDVSLGAKRTFSEGSFTPSELAKLATVLYIAVWLYAKRNQIKDITFGLIPLGLIVGVISGFIMAQPDLSAAATVILLGGLLFFLAGGELKQIVILLLVVVIVGYIVVEISPTGQSRVTNWLVGTLNPLDADYHVWRSIESFVKGGLFGVGIGNGTTKYLGLPVPWTDSIYAVIAEETGWFGASALVGLFTLLLWRGMDIARRAPDLLGSLLAAGLTLWIVAEAMINMSVMVGLVPFAGNALPFISAGGSSLVVTLIAIGILINIDLVSRRETETQGQGANTVYASDGMRRSQRRGSVSRARRASGTRQE